MFEERCLTCGNHLHDDGRAYCSDECQALDTSSPSISSTSSAYSSPLLPYASGCDVPPLVPSMLGSALRKYHDRQSASSSSASSTAWSVETDDEEQDDAYAIHSDPDTSDSLYEPSSKSATSLRARPLAYARRPSGTNTRSTVPRPHRRTSSGHVRGGNPSASEDEYSDFGSSFRDDDLSIPQSAPEWPAHDDTISKAKRTRNRTSLPAYFSLLQISSATQPELSRKGSPTVSTSSGQTIVRPSPPTPGTISSLPLQSRGRRRDSKSSLSSTSSARSKSDSYAFDYPSARSPPSAAFLPRPRLDSRGSTDPFFGRASDSHRGRTVARRNSSPPPKMDPLADEYSFGFGKDDHTRPRGRARVDELDGTAGPDVAPGYGNGRSGLLHRERSHRSAARFR